MSFGKGLLGGSKPKAVSTSAVQVPDWLDTRNQSLAARAETLSNTGFTPYTQQRVANLTPDAQQAFTLQRGNVGQFNNLINRASQGTTDLFGRANGPTSADISSRMNPFIQNVLDVERRKIYDDYSTQNEDLRRQAGMVGAFGGSRMAIQEAEARKNLNQLLSDTQYRGMFDAFNQAQGQYNRDTDVLSNAIGQALGTVQGGQQANETDILGLIRADAIQRERDQAQLDFNYDEFDRQQATPFDNLAFYANILNPLTSGYAGGQTTTQQKGGSGSKLGNALGMASSIASIAGLFSDERLKENIEKVGELDNGLTIYKYNFKGDPTVQIGVIAQEVEKVKPEAVVDDKESGFKKVDYDQATENFAEGGYVNSRTAKAKRQPIKQIRSPNLPSAQLPEEKEQDIMGLLKNADLENAIGGIRSIFSPNPMTSNIPSVFGQGYSDAMNIGAKMFTFKDGGSPFSKALKDEKAYRDFKYSKVPQFEVDPTKQSIAGVISRRLGNQVNKLPTFISNLPSYGRSMVGTGLDALYPAYEAGFVTPASELTNKQKLNDATRKMEVAVEDDVLKNRAAAIKGGNNKPPSGGEQVVLPPMAPTDGMNMDRAQLNADAVNLPAQLAIPEGLDQLLVGEQGSASAAPPALQLPEAMVAPALLQQDPTSATGGAFPSFEEFIKMTRGEKKETPKDEESKINYPLLAFGLQMLSTDGDFGDQLGAGSEALFKTLKNIDEQKQAERELDIRSANQEGALMNQYIDYLKAMAYMQQVQREQQMGGMDFGDLIQLQKFNYQQIEDQKQRDLELIKLLPPTEQQAALTQFRLKYGSAGQGSPPSSAPPGINPLDDLDLTAIGE